MRKQIAKLALLTILCLASAGSAFAGRRVGVGIVVGAPLWGPWYQPPVVYHSYSYQPYQPYQPVIIERQVPVYVEQPVYPEQQTRASGYWYFCQLPGKYYPEITECPAGWIKVPPRP